MGGLILETAQIVIILGYSSSRNPLIWTAVILDSEYHALSAAVRRIEEEMAQQTVDIGEVRSELVKINDQISRLAQRVTNLESVLN